MAGETPSRGFYADFINFFAADCEDFAEIKSPAISGGAK
jgi:hypothetical protein